MRITKRQLKRIIREEVTNEQNDAQELYYDKLRMLLVAAKTLENVIALESKSSAGKGNNQHLVYLDEIYNNLLDYMKMYKTTDFAGEK